MIKRVIQRAVANSICTNVSKILRLMNQEIEVYLKMESVALLKIIQQLLNYSVSSSLRPLRLVRSCQKHFKASSCLSARIGNCSGMSTSNYKLLQSPRYNRMGNAELATSQHSSCKDSEDGGQKYCFT